MARTQTPAPVDPRVMQALNAQKLHRVRNLQSIYKLFFRVIGCGGTGSKLMPELCQAIALYLEDQIEVGRGRSAELVICDPDVVEVGNLNRQHFPPSDVGKNKAQALAHRYAAAYGLTINYLDQFVDSIDDVSNFVWQSNVTSYPPSNSLYILITAVDNHATRKIIHNWFAEGRHRTHNTRPIFWVDMGNEEINGYVTIGFFGGPEYNFGLPVVTEVFPSLLEEAGEIKPSELPCGAAGIQDLNVNAAAATHCMSFIRALLKKLSVRDHTPERGDRGYNFDNFLNYHMVEFGVQPPMSIAKLNVPENFTNIKPISEGAYNHRHFVE